jgi:hypothetical protein
LGKTLADYQAQANKPFDHEARMKDLLARQAKLNAALDLDKNEKQVALPAEDAIGLAGDAIQGSAIPPRVQRNSAPGMSPSDAPMKVLLLGATDNRVFSTGYPKSAVAPGPDIETPPMDGRSSLSL